MSVKSLTAYRRMVAVLTGGFCGTLTRYGMSTIIQSWLGKGWPYDILFINVTGALLLALVTILADATTWIGPTRRLFLTVGFLGAYTTFSSMILGDVLLLAQGQWWPAILYLMLSLIGGMLAVLLGSMLGQWCVKKMSQRPALKVTLKLPETFSALPLEKAASVRRVDRAEKRDDVLFPEQEG